MEGYWRIIILYIVVGIKLWSGVPASAISDSSIRTWLQHNQSPVTDVIGDLGYIIGHPIMSISISGACMVYGSLTNTMSVLHTGELAAASVVTALAITYGLKLATHRYRPRTGHHAGDWDGANISLDSDRLSFPSAHTSTSFALATVIADEYSHDAIVGWAAYGTAMIVGVSRVIRDDHWLSDVAVGAVIGITAAKWVRQAMLPRTNTSTVKIMPQLYSYGVGLSGEIRF